MNRLEDLFRDPLEPEREDDYFVIETHFDSFAVSLETAIEVERWLDHQPPPRWVVFRSSTGARHRVLAAQIYRISECTAAQRAAGREFNRARKLEDKKDRRPWEDD
jgi:hypothetical protein